MDTPTTDDQPRAEMTLEGPDRGIIRELGGKWAWRFWWPLGLWALSAASIATFRPGASTEAPIPLLLGGLITAVLIWVMGAGSAIKHGHNRTLVRMIATVTTVVVSGVGIAVGAVARVLEATIVGNDNARIFITGSGKGEDHTQFIGLTENLYLDHGVQILAVIAVICWFLVGRAGVGGKAH
ncbi:hypothetical protein [Tessaracoccus antarcticus]|uniref:Uncharacterized protein n=1 Tax=Tessaracoccus antarcticus TaxID=2479848 RepID=A0A3M0GM44_9ACTN|nr:hypothetical protein [Tessaracoccus antarcticus]RMB62249.1 hypothetical protein EAX62_06740 [Tessaracoccus antarcticus]